MFRNAAKMRASLLLLAGASIAALPTVATAAPPTTRTARVAPLPAGIDRPTRQVLLSIGQGELINLPASVANVWTSNPSAADVFVSNPRQIHLFGKAFGEATIYATSASGAVVYSANVRVAQNISSLDQVLKAAMPDANLSVITVGQVAVVSGTVATPEDAAQANYLVKALLNPGQKLTGDEPLKIAVINRIKTATPLQVNLQVRIAEVSRSLVRDIGFNLKTADATSGFQFGIGQGRGFSPQWTPGGPLGVGVTAGSQGTTVVLPTEIGSTFAGAGKLLGLDILGALDLGETIGLVTTLSQPNLTALSGETADFLAGGEFPIPIPQDNGAIGVEFKRYGVSLAYTPTVLANGRISLRVRPEVSELTANGAVVIGNTQIPALSVRRAETTVELGSGQSFMIAGLLTNNANNTLKRTPGLAEIPIISNLFKSTNFRKGETELVIIVTPYLVNPVNANDIKLPTDGFNTPNELQRLLANRISDGKTGGDRPKPETTPDRTAPGPQVGAADAVVPAAPAQPQQRAGNDDSKRSERKNRKSARSGNVGPGFSLN